MDYYLKDVRGKPMQARISVTGGSITLHSRTGKIGNNPPRNPAYVAAFNALFDRINVPTVVVETVLLDSAPVQGDAEQLRLLANRRDFETGVLTQVKNQISHRMRIYGRTPDMPPHQGNANKKIRIETTLSESELVRRLRLAPVAASAAIGAESPAMVAVARLPSSELRKVRAAHIHAAVALLLSGDDAPNFAPSRDYDAVTLAGDKLAPKKVFGLALEAATGITAFPGHFTAGWGTPCFKAIEAAGLWIVPKHDGSARPKPDNATVRRAVRDILPTDEERSWIEGNPKIVSHLRRERDPDLARRKRDEFIRANGRLYCERCELDPADVYGPEAGNACIEVHHHRVHVADMEASHATRLEDLKCLCANCHRVLHRALTLGVAFDLDMRKREIGSDPCSSSPR